jgi:hypothetical protein
MPDKLTSYQNYSGSVAYDGPGPGAYDVSRSLGGIQISMNKTRTQIVHSMQNPGPGAYETKPIIGTTQRYSIGQSRNPAWMSTVADSPGPAHYPMRPAIGGRLQKSMAWRTTNGRNNISAHYNPPPGSYETRGYPGKDTPAFSMAGRLKRVDHLHTCIDAPGPGAYKVGDTLAAPTGSSRKKQAPSYSLGLRDKSELDRAINQKTPGPGQYNMRSMVGPNGAQAKTIGKQVDKYQAVSDTPGPGEYGAYSAPAKKNNAPKFNSRVLYRPPGHTPGPSEYDVYKPLGHDAPKYTIRFKERAGPGVSTLGSHSPGPQAYMMKSVIGGKHSLTPKFKGRPKMGTFTTEETPGPNYDYKTDTYKAKAPQFSFGHDLSRLKEVNPYDVGPGPGAYNCDKPLGTDAPKYSVQRRYAPPIMSNQESPAPGTYNDRYGTVGTKVGITIGRRFYEDAYVSAMNRKQEALRETARADRLKRMQSE